MRAISIKEFGGPEQLTLIEVPLPTPGERELLIRVHAAGLNRADLVQREGHYPPPAGASPLPGMEVSGEVVGLGASLEQSHWRVGDRVCALITGGGYAEYVVAAEECCLPIPENITTEDAAALPEAVFTVWANLFRFPVSVRAGETLLIQGGTSGIGSTALQLARARGIRAAATAGSASKCARCLEFGAEFAVDYHEDWTSALREWAPAGLNAILDIVGGPYFAEHVSLLAPRGRLTNIAFPQGSQVSLDLRQLMVKRLVVTGSTMRARPVAEKGELRDEIEGEVWPLLLTGQLRPIIEARLPLEQAAEAHRLMESGTHVGKVLLSVSQ
jgi:NADPH2:quinone reductase